ncbi:hypothetical protein [Paeniclostridium hominis]|uniref:hypothetical protein n=1 Tax=Paeniclostridium hominis TaxID=2764329 RepID=UPI0022E1D85B|nr:hypothetical protein [Paeniclostridium hominis]
MSLNQKIMYGFSDIHVARKIGNTYESPIKLEGAKSVEASLNYSYTEGKVGNRTIRFSEFKGGEGTISLIGLSKEEYALLFGSEVNGNKVTCRTTDKSPNLALMFSKEQLDGTRKGYCIYNIACKPIPISATTLEGGTIKEQDIEIDFFIESLEDKIYYIDEEDGTFFDLVRL